jgi:hypothetical protein
LEVERPCLLGGFETKPLVEHHAQSLVTHLDRLTKPKLAFRLESKPPENLVESVRGESALRGFESAERVAGLKAGPADLLEELDVRTAKAADVALGPKEICADKWLVPEEGESSLKKLQRRVAARPIDFGQQAVQLVDVDSHVVAVEPVAISFARDPVAEQLPRISDRLVEAMAASLWVVARPERF